MKKPSPFSLHDRQILVAGASSGIGLSICEAIVAAGGKIIGIARREEYLNKMVENLGRENALCIPADLTIDAQIENVVEQIPDINGLVYAAGISKLLPLKFIKRENLEEVMNINYFSMVVLLTQLVKRKKIIKNADSSVVLISSVAQQVGTKFSLLYTGSKGAMTAASRVMANELSSLKIRVNTIEPGMVQTDMTTEMESILSSETLEADKRKYPLGSGSPDDVANAAVYLLSNASRWMTGQTLTIDGGRYKLID